MGIRNCFVKVNTDAVYRARFIKDPVAVLREEGVTLGAKDQKELVELVTSLRESLPNLGRLPRGYEMVKEMAEGTQAPHEVEALIF